MVQPVRDFYSEHSTDVNNSVQKVSENEIDITETHIKSIVIGTTSLPNGNASNERQRIYRKNIQEVTKNKITIKGSTAEVVRIGVIQNLN